MHVSTSAGRALIPLYRISAFHMSWGFFLLGQTSLETLQQGILGNVVFKYKIEGEYREW